MRFISSLAAVSCCVALAACTSPGPEYHFTADQLAWQPYKEGQVLRFGNGRTAAVRTYRVTRIIDVMTGQSGGWGFKAQPSYQSVTALLQRTDSLGDEFDAFGLLFDFEHPPVVGGSEVLVNAYLKWDKSITTPYTALLPVDALDQGLPLDTTRYGSIRLLPTYTLGPATYTSVVRYALRPVLYSSNINPITELYLTKAKGVVGFVQRNTLWYRVP